jgi:hypothetical protein
VSDEAVSAVHPPTHHPGLCAPHAREMHSSAGDGVREAPTVGGGAVFGAVSSVDARGATSPRRPLRLGLAPNVAVTGRAEAARARRGSAATPRTAGVVLVTAREVRIAPRIALTLSAASIWGALHADGKEQTKRSLRGPTAHVDAPTLQSAMAAMLCTPTALYHPRRSSAPRRARRAVHVCAAGQVGIEEGHQLLERGGYLFLDLR